MQLSLVASLQCKELNNVCGFIFNTHCAHRFYKTLCYYNILYIIIYSYIIIIYYNILLHYKFYDIAKFAIFILATLAVTSLQDGG